MGEERGKVKSEAIKPDREGDRARLRQDEEGSDVEGHLHRPMQDEGGTEDDEPDVEAHKVKPYHKP